MGVLNITPDSFSDAGLSLDQEFLNHQINNFNKHQVQLVDIGFESTAPINPAVSEKLERDRMNQFINHLNPSLLTFASLSIDTYKPAIAFEFYEKLRSLNFKGRIVWNDISAVLDQDSLRWLKLDKDSALVSCHNLAQSRSVGSAHMNYVQDNEIDYVMFFKERELFFNQFETSRVWFDPTPGFSKSFSQNLSLLRAFPNILKSFSSHRPWVVALSKKSFLRTMTGHLTPNLSKEELLEKSEFLHLTQILTLRCLSNPLYFRCHNPETFSISDKFLQFGQIGTNFE